MKKGISLVALIITIIVLIILTAAVIWSSGDTPEQTKLAVFYNDITVVQEAVTTKMLTNYVDEAISSLGEASATSKWKNILSNDEVTGTPLNTVLGNSVKLYKFATGSGDKLGVGLKDTEMSEYVVDPATATVYYLNGILAKLSDTETVIYNRSLSITSTASNFADAKAAATKITSYVRGSNYATSLSSTVYGASAAPSASEETSD